MARNENGPVVRWCSVSGRNCTAADHEASAKTTRKMKVARQPKAVCSTPPMAGATIGANAVIDPISDNSRPARTPE